MLDKSWALAFRKLIFEKIDERRYVELYSKIVSRPSFPLNVWLGLEIIKVRGLLFELHEAYSE